MNFKRKRPKSYTLRDCGHRHCKYDQVSYHSINGRDRYLYTDWKRVKYEGIHSRPWRYVHKNIDPRVV